MSDDAQRSLGELLAWLDRHINLEAIERGLAGRSAEPTLDRIRALCAALGDPQANYPAIHVTGTNGKGSTTRMTTALLRAQGLVVGTIMSPHLEQMNERISRNFEPISDADLLEGLGALEALERFVEARDLVSLPPTWFELVTALAYRYFSDVAVDAAVVEVGLGGRWDATNVIDAVVSVVTNVELDHVEILGPTRAHIAREKAGIIKPGATVVVGETDPEIVGVFEEEAERANAAALWRRDLEFACERSRIAYGGRVIDLRTPQARYSEIFIPLFGAHQGLNASVALAAAEAFFGAPLEEDVVAEAFAEVTVPGRLEVVSRQPLVVLDGAHNPAGATVLGNALREDFAGAKNVVVVMGCLRGRDPIELLNAIGPARITHVVATEPASPRAQAAKIVADAATALGYEVTTFEDVGEAIRAAQDLAGDDDLVVVTGSLYVVGAARAFFRRLGSLRP
jgi:dihydrofolate synthase / folylpolyglutamate synthase